MVKSYIHHEINFNTSDEADAKNNNTSLSVFLDSESNNEKTQFPINSSAFIFIHHSHNYVVNKSDGVLSKVGSNIIINKEENIVFAYSKEASLSFVPQSITNYGWIGNDSGSVKFSGKNISLNSEKTGLLKVEYTIIVDRWKITSSIIEEVIVAAYQEIGDLRSSIIVKFIDSDNLKGPYILTVKNYCTGDIVPGTSVWIDGILKGQTDSEGKISIGKLSIGEHSIRKWHPDYIPSESDNLDNDKIIIN